MSEVVHLLDVGDREYGEAVLAELAGLRILVDGGHLGDDRLIESQLGQITRQDPPYELDLLIVSHCHADHIGCLPSLIAADKLHAEWALVADPDFGWGRVEGAVDALPLPDTLAAVAAGLREERPAVAEMSDRQIDEFLADAFSLEQRYRSMLDQLKDAGTRVVRFQRNPSSQRELKQAFAPIELELFGPSRRALEQTALLLAGQARDAAIILRDAADAVSDRVAQFRALADAVDAQSRQGFLVNAQSVIAACTVDKYRLLLGGDYQFVDLDTSDPIIVGERDRLLREIASRAPYEFAKLSHHGSTNAFDQKFLGLLGSVPLVGLSSGRGQPKHPPPETLDLLDAHRDETAWVRTDRNGHVSIEFTADGPRVSLADGELSDATPNKPRPDTGTTAAPRREAPPAGRPATTGPQVQTVAAGDARRITITIDLGPDQEAGAPGKTPTSTSTTGPGADRLLIGGGRQLGALLFVTHAERLAANIGQLEADFAIHSLKAGGYDVLDLEGAPQDAAATSTAIHRRIDELSTTQGVVVVGGYDVVPPHRVDTLPAELNDTAAELRRIDADHFIVWSDDPHVDIDGDRLPELPISRIPDARSSEFLLASALQAEPDNRPTQRGGVRNSQRPFAADVYDLIGGGEALGVSEPISVDTLPDGTLRGRAGYIMLHGDWQNATRFWGETSRSVAVETLRLDQVPDPAPTVVFAGCCWGALAVSTPAGRYTPGAPIPARNPDQSIAVTCLARGALAFVGCTGTHYSPVEPPYESASGLMHRFFWDEIADGAAPAVALFTAKGRYAATFPQIRDATELAIRAKTLTQFTCLGLGW